MNSALLFAVTIALARVKDLKVIDPRSKTKALVKAYSLRM